MTLLPTSIPVGIPDMALRFVKDTSNATINQNTEHMTEDTGQTIVGGLPDTAYDYKSITKRSVRPRREGI